MNEIVSVSCSMYILRDLLFLVGVEWREIAPSELVPGLGSSREIMRIRETTNLWNLLPVRIIFKCKRDLFHEHNEGLEILVNEKGEASMECKRGAGGHFYCNGISGMKCPSSP